MRGRTGNSDLVDGILQALASLELGLVRRLDRHGLTRTRITAGRSLALGDLERAEADQAHFVTARQGLSDSIENAFDGTRRIVLRKTAGIGNCADQVVLVH